MHATYTPFLKNYITRAGSHLRAAQNGCPADESISVLNLNRSPRLRRECEVPRMSINAVRSRAAPQL